MSNHSHSYWSDIAKRFWGQKVAILGSIILALFILCALYAPFLASSKPIIIRYNGEWYLPLLRYYFSSYFFSKSIDIFFNCLGVVFLFLLFFYFVSRKSIWIVSAILLAVQLILFVVFGFLITLDPANDKERNIEKQQTILKIVQDQHNLIAPYRPHYPLPNFNFELKFDNEYGKLNLVIDTALVKQQNERILSYFKKDQNPPYTLYYVQKAHEKAQTERFEKQITDGLAAYEKRRNEENELRRRLANKEIPETPEVLKSLQTLTEQNIAFEELQNRLKYLKDKEKWLDEQTNKITYMVMPFVRPLHWEDDAGGDQAVNLHLPFTELSRINRKDLLAALIFGARISLFVGLMATAISLSIGIPLGLTSGYYGGKTDIVLSRLVEVWESMPAFFMLLLIVTLMQTKSIFLIIAVIALFSWTSAFRFVRAETFRQREMLYVDACHALGFSDLRIIFNHLLVNCIVPVVALLPFEMMSAITQESGLAFLGLGEDQSCSWGTLMDEGRAAFPAESALLWPPAIALTILLIAIAFVGEGLRNAMDPKEART
jgi:peptide/nickel transport system permease protein